MRAGIFWSWVWFAVFIWFAWGENTTQSDSYACAAICCSTVWSAATYVVRKLK